MSLHTACSKLDLPCSPHKSPTLASTQIKAKLSTRMILCVLVKLSLLAARSAVEGKRERDLNREKPNRPITFSTPTESSLGPWLRSA